MAYVRDLLKRASVVELVVGFVVAEVVVYLMRALVGLALVAAWHPAGFENSSVLFGHRVHGQPYSFAAGAVSYYEVVAWALTLAILVATATLVIPRLAGYLWDEQELRDCPFCLSPIPAAASVCDSCTRAVASTG